jgi:hypothetical protein
MNFHCNNKGRHYSDPGYKPFCDKQCAECAQDYPAAEQNAYEAEASMYVMDTLTMPLNMIKQPAQW